MKLANDLSTNPQSNQKIIHGTHKKKTQPPLLKLGEDCVNKWLQERHNLLHSSHPYRVSSINM